MKKRGEFIFNILILLLLGILATGITAYNLGIVPIPPAATSTLRPSRTVSPPQNTFTPSAIPYLSRTPILRSAVQVPTLEFTPFPFVEATLTPLDGSLILIPTLTGFPTETDTAPCSCTRDKYNCNDFANLSLAQACYNYCESLGRGDIHHLDKNQNGVACD